MMPRGIQLCTTAYLAQRLRVHPDTVFVWIKGGILEPDYHYVKGSREYRQIISLFTAEHVEQLVKEGIPGK